MTLLRSTAVLMALALVSLAAHQEPARWPQFRGPGGRSTAEGSNPPIQWSDTQNVRWKLNLPGPGSSSPVVWGNRVFLTCYSGYGVPGSTAAAVTDLKRHVLCIDRETGTVLWEKTITSDIAEDPASGFITEHGYASNTPATDGERVYVFLSKWGVYAFDMEGRQVWHTGLGTQSSRNRWGSGTGVILYKDLVIVTAADEGRKIAALNKADGKIVWEVPSPTLESTYNTPVLADLPDGKQQLILAVPGEIWAFEPDTGKTAWFAGTDLGNNVVPSVVICEGLAVVNGGFPNTGCVAFKLGGSGNVTDTHLAWRATDRGSYVPTPVYYNGHLYNTDDNGFATCMEAATGRFVYRQRIAPPGRSKAFYASPVLAGDRIYAVSRSQGTFVIRAKPEYELIAQNKLESDDSFFNATPAIVGNQILLRSNKALYCIEAKSEGQ